MSWFAPWTAEREKESIMGRAIWETFDVLTLLDQRINKSLRLPLGDVYRIGGIGTVPVNRIETGLLTRDMIVNFAPSNVMSRMKSLEMNCDVEEVSPGYQVLFNVLRIPRGQLKHCFLIVLHRLSQICQGYTLTLYCHTTCISCECIELIEKVDRRSGKAIESASKYLKSKGVAIVKILPLSPINLERFTDYPSLGRFIICDMEEVVIVGIIVDAEKKLFEIPGQ